MTIAVADLKFYQAERMTDFDDGGGQMTANEIVSGADNQIFDDVSDVDRAVGDASIRKVYVGVTSANTDKYLDAGVVIFKPPADPYTSVVAFSTGNYYDERDDLVTLLESSISRSVRYNGWLYGQHIAGQRAVLIWTRPEVAAFSVGGRLELVAKAGTVEQYSEVLWITSLNEERRTMRDDKGEYEIKVITAEIAYPLTSAYTGLEPQRIDPNPSTATALLYQTRYNPDIVPLYGIKPLVTGASVGAYTVRVNGGLYQQMIPTGLQETALPDVLPGGNHGTLIAGRETGVITWTSSAEVVKPNVGLFLGRGAKPGSVTITVSGATFTDKDGVMQLAGADVGTIDYGNGVITWASNLSNFGTANKTVAFTPTARALRIADTAAQLVTLENRGYVWLMTLSPIPAPATLSVSYQVNGVWYVLREQGGGLLVGVDSSYGSGNLNFQTGTVTITTGALPDVDSELIYTWGTPVNYTARGGYPVDAPVVRGQTAQGGIQPGTVQIAWAIGLVNYAVDDAPDADGALTGSGTGEIRYDTGEWILTPTLLPPTGTEFTISYTRYDAGSQVSETFADPLLDPNGNLHLELANPSIAPGSLRIELPVESQEMSGSYVNARDEYIEDWWSYYGNDDTFHHYLASSEQTISSESGSGTTIKVTGNLRIRDDANGALIVRGGTNGVVDYLNGTLDFAPTTETVALKAVTASKELGSRKIDPVGWERSEVGTNYRETVAGYETETVTAAFVSGQGTVTVTYHLAGATTPVEETVTLTQLQLDLTRGYAETITSGSTRFRIGTDVFVDTAGQIYRNPSPETGAGSLAGTLNRATGRVFLNLWTAGITNAVTLDSLVTEVGGQPLDECVFRTPVSPLKPGVFQVRWVTLGGAAKSKSVGGSGILMDNDATIIVNYETGVVRLRFGLWKEVADLTPAELAEPWYNPEAIIEIGGVENIWKPAMVMADSIIYNAVAQTTLPPDRDMIGINAARLPPDGKGLIFQRGQLALVHHTTTKTENSLSPTQEINCNRPRLYRVVIDDANNQRLPASFYTVNRELGIVTMAADLNLTGYTGPYTLSHTVADLARTTAVDINGTLTLNKPVSHDYPADDSYVSGVLYIGTLQARYTNLFAQSTWTSVWSDTLIGSAPLAQYNDTAYPIQVSNLGAYKDRILIKFTSSTAFQVIGENLGIIATGNINENCAPVNQLTGQPYFTLDYRGWGAGWATGNCVRFNLIGANYPVDLIRAIQPSNPSGLDDSVELLFVGNVDQE